jgi:hypothetical protein
MKLLPRFPLQLLGHLESAVLQSTPEKPFLQLHFPVLKSQKPLSLQLLGQSLATFLETEQSSPIKSASQKQTLM